MNLKAKLAGKFVVFDGPDGCGKGTQLKLVGTALSQAGLAVTFGKDPGGTPIGERIRALVLGNDLLKMDVRCETLLFMASRAQLVGEVVEPAMKAGHVVLCDRFISSTCAYQGAQGYDIANILPLGRLAVGQTWPELTVILDLPPEEGFRRTGRKAHHAGQNRKKSDSGQGLLLGDIQPDAMEGRPLAYHRKVRQGFLNLPTDYPGKVEIIDAMGTPEEVHQRVMEMLGRVDI